MDMWVPFILALDVPENQPIAKTSVFLNRCVGLTVMAYHHVSRSCLMDMCADTPLGICDCAVGKILIEMVLVRCETVFCLHTQCRGENQPNPEREAYCF